MASLQVIRATLHEVTSESSDDDMTALKQQRDELVARMSSPPAIQTLQDIFGLSPFERDLLLVCAGLEMDSRFRQETLERSNSPQAMTFGFALSALPDAHWSAITPNAPLRYWEMIQFDDDSSLTNSPLRIDERILHYIVGAQVMDERLQDIVTPVELHGELALSHAELAQRIIGLHQQHTESSPVIYLNGGDSSVCMEIAGSAYARLGAGLLRMRVDDLPGNTSERKTLVRLLERETILRSSALYIDCESASQYESMLTGFIQMFTGLLVIGNAEKVLPHYKRPSVKLSVSKPRAKEQESLWREALESANLHLNGTVEILSNQFSMNAPDIRSASADVLGWIATQGADATQDDIQNVLWDACRVQARPRLDDLAQRIDSHSDWDDLVLPEQEKRTLHEITAHVRGRRTVYEEWGFAHKSNRGLGISGLFSGMSGTGKTLAAEVLANALRLDLYRIDLSSVVSKYIGETETNLRRIFDAAESGGVVLLFDEADALFGKRSEVKDSHDRYANIEVSYLLQRMEAYQGLAILTTNFREALDTAFLRRIRFIVQFPFPSMEDRAEIWKRIFPQETPTRDLDIDRLSQLNISGGNIRNIALNAAFLAAEAREAVCMEHILQATRSEYTKLEKPLSNAEVRGWVT